MASYPLKPLLRVRHFREDKAKSAARAAEQALQAAEEEKQQREKELAEYIDWRMAEVERRYNAIMGKALTLGDLDAFKAGLSALAAAQADREAAVIAADEARKKAAEALRQAQAFFTQARKDTAKIAAHKDIWLEESRKEALRQEDMELEEFTPAALA